MNNRSKRQGGAGRRSSRRHRAHPGAVRERARDVQPLRDGVPHSHQGGRVPVSRLSGRSRPERSGRDHQLGRRGVRHARSPLGRGRAARVGTEVRDRLSRQPPAGRDHALLRRKVPQRQRSLPDDGGLRLRGRGGQDHRRARVPDRAVSPMPSSRPCRTPRRQRSRSSFRPRTGAALTLEVVTRPHRFRRRALPDQRRDRRDRAPRHRGGAPEKRGAGPGTRRRAGGGDGRRARRRLDRAGSGVPRGARQSNGAGAVARRQRAEPVEDGGRPDARPATSACS